MKLKSIGALRLAGVLGCLVLVFIIEQLTSEPGKDAAGTDSQQNQASPSRRASARATEDLGSPTPPALTTTTSPRPATNAAHNSHPAAPANKSKSQPGATPRSGQSASEVPTVLDAAAREQLGRLALSYVGTDPVADEVWSWLINDPELSPKVREDLIEDLNENGFSDDNGRRATVDDLPLIENRLLLIEEHAPFAFDDVNAAAFAEAYKDLAEMWWRLTGR